MISWTTLSRNLDEAFRGVSLAMSSRTPRKEILAIAVNAGEGPESSERLLILTCHLDPTCSSKVEGDGGDNGGIAYYDGLVEVEKRKSGRRAMGRATSGYISGTDYYTAR